MKIFDDFSEAFDYCREKNCPVIVMVKNEKWKLFPSGSAKKMQGIIVTSGTAGKGEGIK